MAELTLRLVVDPATGKKNVEIHYESESDALPAEHEDEHRRIVAALLQSGTLREDELGEVVVVRDEGQGAVEAVDDESASRTRGRVRS